MTARSRRGAAAVTRPATVALWLRVSTADQDAAAQEPALRPLAARRRWTVGDRRRGGLDVLAAWALDRLSRQGPLATLQLVDRLGRAATAVVSVQEPWTEAPGELRELLRAIVGGVGKQESVRRSERTKAGMARARAAGQRIGRPAWSRDRRRRRRSGYYQLWAANREADAGEGDGP